MSIQEVVKKYITNDGNNDNEEISEIFDNNEDIEIALEIWENFCEPDENLVDVEREVAYQRKHRNLDIVK